MTAGMEVFAGAVHLPVLCQEAVDALNVREGGCYVDGTFGVGGYSSEILSRTDCRLFAFDRDPSAVMRAETLTSCFGKNFSIIQGCFGGMDKILFELGVSRVDAIVLDLGVSSPQIDDPERGFSFRFDGPLDMRMSLEGVTAEDIVNTMGEIELADVIFNYGEERLSRRISKAIIAARLEDRIKTTKRLADIVRKVVPRGRKGKDIDPATRTFQALRIYINDELRELERGLEAAERILAPGGRLAVVAFHSLEDRRVKNFFNDRQGSAGGRSRHAPPEVTPFKEASFQVITKKPIYAASTEVAYNPRARSARLRVAQRTAAPAWSESY
jgi:16S rRNA (cytosine1402-N4)-methyltransferase